MCPTLGRARWPERNWGLNGKRQVRHPQEDAATEARLPFQSWDGPAHRPYNVRTTSPGNGPGELTYAILSNVLKPSRRRTAKLPPSLSPNASTHAPRDAGGGGTARWVVPAESGRDVWGEAVVPLPLRAGNHCLSGERSCPNEGRRVSVTVRAGGRWNRVVLGALGLGGTHGDLEEAPRASGLGGGRSGSLTPPGPACSFAWLLRAGGDAEALVSMEDRPPTTSLVTAGSGADPSSVPTLALLDLSRH